MNRSPEMNEFETERFMGPPMPASIQAGDARLVMRNEIERIATVKKRNRMREPKSLPETFEAPMTPQRNGIGRACHDCSRPLKARLAPGDLLICKDCGTVHVECADGNLAGASQEELDLPIVFLIRAFRGRT